MLVKLLLDARDESISLAGVGRVGQVHPEAPSTGLIAITDAARPLAIGDAEPGVTAFRVVLVPDQLGEVELPGLLPTHEHHPLVGDVGSPHVDLSQLLHPRNVVAAEGPGPHVDALGDPERRSPVDPSAVSLGPGYLQQRRATQPEVELLSGSKLESFAIFQTVEGSGDLQLGLQLGPLDRPCLLLGGQQLRLVLVPQVV